MHIVTCPCLYRFALFTIPTSMLRERATWSIMASMMKIPGAVPEQTERCWVVCTPQQVDAKDATMHKLESVLN